MLSQIHQGQIADPSIPANITAPAAAYLSQALEIMQANALHRQTIDWMTLVADIWGQASGAIEPQDTYPAIEFALRQINGGHSFFWPPEKNQVIQSWPRRLHGNRPACGSASSQANTRCSAGGSIHY